LLNRFYDKFIFANALKYKKGNFHLVNLPFLFCPAELLKGLLETGSPEFDRMVYYSFKNSVSTHLIPSFGTEFGFHGAKMINFFEKYFVSSGWGMIKNVDLDLKAKKAIVQVSNNPVAKKMHSKHDLPVDHILRGIFAGLFSSVFKESVECVETHCMALGEADCEFIVKRQREFDLSDKRVKQQLELKV